MNKKEQAAMEGLNSSWRNYIREQDVEIARLKALLRECKPYLERRVTVLSQHIPLTKERRLIAEIEALDDGP